MIKWNTSEFFNFLPRCAHPFPLVWVHFMVLGCACSLHTLTAVSLRSPMLSVQTNLSAVKDDTVLPVTPLEWVGREGEVEAGG